MTPARMSLSAIFLVAFSAACTSGIDDPDCAGCGGPQGDPEATVGCMIDTPAAEATVVLDGETVELVHGPQGGTHIEVNMRAFVLGDGMHVAEIEIADETSKVAFMACGEQWADIDAPVIGYAEPGPKSLVVIVTDPDGAEVARLEQTVTVTE